MLERSPGARLATALYWPGAVCCIPTEITEHDPDRQKLAIQLLTGGLYGPGLPVDRILEWNHALTADEVRQFLGAVAGSQQSLSDGTAARIADVEGFQLPGRPKLEALIKEHVLDLHAHRERYAALGVLPPNGILLHGPPGTGKTFAVRQTAHALGWPLIEVNVGAIGSPYIHETSVKIRQAFDAAAAQSPCILLFDEIDALGGARTNDPGRDHKVEEVGELLRQLETAGARGILVFATSNRFAALDEALLRRGRFDYVIELELPNADDVRAALQSLLSSRPTQPGLDCESAVRRLEGRPMSDVAWVVNEAARIAARSGRAAIDQESLSDAVAELKQAPPLLGTYL